MTSETVSPHQQAILVREAYRQFAAAVATMTDETANVLDALPKSAQPGRYRAAMADRTRRPILFLDVDGPLLPFGGNVQLGPRDSGANTHLARLDPAIGLRLIALGCELVWATAWEDDANTEIAPRIGLPQLPVVNWPDSSDEREREDEWFGLHWKTRHLVGWAAGRPFVWIDDEITDADKSWVTANHPTQALLHRVESSRGLSDEDFTALDHWLRTSTVMH